MVYIEESLKEELIAARVSKQPMAFPWAAALTAMPFLAIIWASFSTLFGFYMLLTCLPDYMSHVLDFNIRGAGLGGH